jgi:hypothetical protein
MTSPVQLRFRLPLDPAELAELLAPERAVVYAELRLDAQQRAAAEEAVRQVLVGRYARRPAR